MYFSRTAKGTSTTSTSTTNERRCHFSYPKLYVCNTGLNACFLGRWWDAPLWSTAQKCALGTLLHYMYYLLCSCLRQRTAYKLKKIAHLLETELYPCPVFKSALNTKLMAVSSTCYNFSQVAPIYSIISRQIGRAFAWRQNDAFLPLMVMFTSFR